MAFFYERNLLQSYLKYEMKTLNLILFYLNLQIEKRKHIRNNNIILKATQKKLKENEKLFFT